MFLDIAPEDEKLKFVSSLAGLASNKIQLCNSRRQSAMSSRTWMARADYLSEVCFLVACISSMASKYSKWFPKASSLFDQLC